jgi:hypothetical protein
MLRYEATIVDKRTVSNKLKSVFEQTEIVFELSIGVTVKFIKTGRESNWWVKKYKEFSTPLKGSKCVVEIPHTRFFPKPVEYPVKNFYSTD